ncbi:MAG: NAD(P)-binding protein [Bacteroidetes bacterium]|nr:NAD(P)-binding protein [Bacteroidota bacterium]
MQLKSRDMIKLKIDNKSIEVREGIKLIDAARDNGINISSLCYKKELPHYTSCMLCMVKDNRTGKFIPSCSVVVEEGMRIDASGPEVIAFRREALSLLLTEHRAECEAPCKVVCPVGLNIPLMNRYIQKGDFSLASQLLYFEMGMPESICSVCSRYCEKACRRKMIDAPVAITAIKKFVTGSTGPAPIIRQTEKSAKIAIIGAGASGLIAAFSLAKYGHRCVLFEKSNRIGGTFISELSARGLPASLPDNEMNFLVNSGIEIRLNTPIEASDLENTLIPGFDIIINASSGNIGSDKIDPGETYILFEKDTRILDGKYIFFVGSAAKHDKLVIRRIGNARKSAEAIHNFLQTGILSKPKKRFNSTIGEIEEDEKREWLKECPEKTQRFTEPGSEEECIGEALNCMHCDCRAIDDCRLREIAENLNIGNPKLKLVNHPLEKKINRTNKLIFENSKCIKCGLCVRVSTDETDNPSLCFTGRGFISMITEPLTADFDSILLTGADNAINVCPTGALAKKE